MADRFAYQQVMVKSIEVCDMPVRAAKFIPRKNWIIVGADDLVVRVYNYNTLEKVTQFDAHTDYVRQFAIHPTRPYVLSCSDDMTIKLWDWERGWKCVTTYEGHVHYVMAVAFNPKDGNTFATASLDRTIKIWSLASPNANYTLEGHEKGVNCLDYYGGGDRPYLVSGGDDFSVRVWDYQTKACVRVLEGHTQNIAAVLYHPDLPLIISGSEDGSVRIWNANNFRSETTLNFNLDRVWALAIRKGSTEIAIGCDEGSMVVQLGKGEPSASMDSNGKLIWARHNEIMSGNVRQLFENDDASSPEEAAPSIKDGHRLMLPAKELGHCELYPQAMAHSPSGRLVAVCGDGEWIIYTALAWRNKTFGKGLEFVWSPSNDYAVRETPSRVMLYSNFTESGSIKMATPAERLFGGALLGVTCAGGQLCFFDWISCRLIRRIDVQAKAVHWNEAGNLVAVCSDDCVFFLRFDKESLLGAQSTVVEEVEDSFEGIGELEERITSAMWLGDSAFIFVTAGHKLAYIMVSGQEATVSTTIFPISVLERPLFLVGFLEADSRLILVDKDANAYAYTLSQAVMEYEAAILRGDTAAADSLVNRLPPNQVDHVAQFLASIGHKELALSLATDNDLRFSLAMQLKRLEMAFDLAAQADSPHWWRQLGDLALAEWKTSLAEKCFLKSNDLPSLLLLYSSAGNASGLHSLASLAMEQGLYNIAFTCYFVTGRREECFELLMQSKRYSEAALFARSYLPSAMERAVRCWREFLAESKHRAADLLADPSHDPGLFPEYSDSLSAETSALGPNNAGASGAGPIAGMGPRQSASNTSTTTSGLMMASVPTITTTSSSITSPYYDPSAFSDHMSMEVNTGTGSMRADDLDDLASVTVSESREDSLAMARHLERLSIQELEEEHRQLEECEEDHGMEEKNLEKGGKVAQPTHLDKHEPALVEEEEEEEKFDDPPELSNEENDEKDDKDEEMQEETTSSVKAFNAPKDDPIVFDDEDGWD